MLCLFHFRTGGGEGIRGGGEGSPKLTQPGLGAKGASHHGNLWEIHDVCMLECSVGGSKSKNQNCSSAGHPLGALRTGI